VEPLPLPARYRSIHRHFDYTVCQNGAKVRPLPWWLQQPWFFHATAGQLSQGSKPVPALSRGKIRSSTRHCCWLGCCCWQGQQDPPPQKKACFLFRSRGRPRQQAAGQQVPQDKHDAGQEAFERAVDDDGPKSQFTQLGESQFPVEKKT